MKYTLTIIIILYILGYFIYNNSVTEPYIKNTELFKITDDLLLTNYKDHQIYITENIKDVTRKPIIKTTTIGDYITNYIYKQDNSFYLKSEDSYNFLNETGIDKSIYESIETTLQLPRGIHKSVSFWYGSAGTRTTFHYDIDHFNLLYVCSGYKTVYLISPKYNKYMNGNTRLQFGASWSSRTLDEVLADDRIVYTKYTVKKNQLLNIPRYWWHYVYNEEPTIAYTYHIYTMPYMLFNYIPNLFCYI